MSYNDVRLQRRLAEQGVSKLQADWNRSECASIYDQSDGYSRRNQLRDKWLGQCAVVKRLVDEVGQDGVYILSNGAVLDE